MGSPTWTMLWVIPTATSIIGGVIVLLVQRYYVVRGEISFFGYPKISGTYKVTYPEKLEYGHEVAKIGQVGSRISGDIHSISDDTHSDFIGNVTRTGFITYQFKPKISHHNDYGAGFLQLNKYRNEADGIVLFIDDETQAITSIKVHVEKYNH